MAESSLGFLVELKPGVPSAELDNSSISNFKCCLVKGAKLRISGFFKTELCRDLAGVLHSEAHGGPWLFLPEAKKKLISNNMNDYPGLAEAKPAKLKAANWWVYSS